jgi:hypothetical protein
MPPGGGTTKNENGIFRIATIKLKVVGYIGSSRETKEYI